MAKINQANAANELRKMKLHDTLEVNRWISIVRVSGGWIYQFLCPPEEGTDFGVFVPEQSKTKPPD